MAAFPLYCAPKKDRLRTQGAGDPETADGGIRTECARRGHLSRRALCSTTMLRAGEAEYGFPWASLPRLRTSRFPLGDLLVPSPLCDAQTRLRSQERIEWLRFDVSQKNVQMVATGNPNVGTRSAVRQLSRRLQNLSIVCLPAFGLYTSPRPVSLGGWGVRACTRVTPTTFFEHQKLKFGVFPCCRGVTANLSLFLEFRVRQSLISCVTDAGRCVAQLLAVFRHSPFAVISSNFVGDEQDWSRGTDVFRNGHKVLEYIVLPSFYVHKVPTNGGASVCLPQGVGLVNLAGFRHQFTSRRDVPRASGSHCSLSASPEEYEKFSVFWVVEFSTCPSYLAATCSVSFSPEELRKIGLVSEMTS